MVPRNSVGVGVGVGVEVGFGVGVYVDVRWYRCWGLVVVLVFVLVDVAGSWCRFCWC